jgi:anti-sigma regulatory factor (Ser/Thr protein kinase)
MLLDRLSKTGSLTPSAPWRIDNLVQLELPPARESPAVARQAVAEACRRWDLPAEAVETALLATSELVTNAVMHAGTPLVLAVEYDDPHLTIAVGDGDDSLPEKRPASDEREDGRGVAIVDLLGATWGVQRTILGKTVWVSIVVPDG